MGRCLPIRFVRCSALSLTLATSVLCAADAVSITVWNPRPFGYVIGDLIEQRVAIDLDAPLELEREALPRAGRLDLWLDRRKPRLTTPPGPGRRHELLLQYQVLNAPTEVKVIALPELRLRLRGGERPIEDTVGEWPITIGPITPEYVLARAGLEDLRPDQAPPQIDTRGHAKRVLLYAVLLAIIGLYATARRFGISPSHRPFALAWRDLRRLPGASTGADTQRAAMQRMHRAFDETAGRTVFKENLERFVTEHPQFAALREEADAFYSVSRAEFFGGGTHRHMKIDWFLAFARRLRDAERKAAPGP